MKIEWEPRETVATAFLSQMVAEYGGAKPPLLSARLSPRYHGASEYFLHYTRGGAALRLAPRYVLSPRLHGASEFRSPSVRRTA